MNTEIERFPADFPVFVHTGTEKRPAFFGKKKFPKVIGLQRKKEITKYFPWNTKIVFTEKLDGANGRVYATKDHTTGKPVLYVLSRRTEVGVVRGPNDYEGDFRGFVPYVAKHFDAFATTMYDGEIVYGEWLVPHTVKYPEDMLKTFYVFPDGEGTYHPVTNFSGIGKVPIVLVAEEGARDYAHLESLFVEALSVAKERFPAAEGVVGTVTNSAEKYPPFRVKLVAKDFKEMNVKNLKKNDYEIDPEEILTEATFKKRLHDILDLMDMSIDDIANNKQKAGELIGRLSHTVWRDFVEEFLVDELISKGGKKLKTLNVAQLRNTITRMTATFLQSEGVI